MELQYNLIDVQKEIDYYCTNTDMFAYDGNEEKLLGRNLISASYECSF